eukprot:6925889-Pyramimonas_sp.AAC.1
MAHARTWSMVEARPCPHPENADRQGDRANASLRERLPLAVSPRCHSCRGNARLPPSLHVTAY